MPTTYQIITDRILQSLEAGIIPWRRPWTTAGFAPTNLASKKAYRGVNNLMLEGLYESPYWVTFNQARSLGGHVNAGERSTLVVFWKLGKYEKEGSDEERTWALLRYYHVFNVEQTSLAAAAKELLADAKDHQRIPSGEEIVAGFAGPQIKHRAGARACYSPSIDQVTMPLLEQFDSSEDYYSTLFHELVHSTGHKNRLHREDGTFGSYNYGKEELIAEIGSAFLCGMTNISKPDVEENTTAYLQNWIQVIKADPKLVVQAAAAAQSAVDLILNRRAVIQSPEEESVAA
jgi:antirestriction protein ArdC